MRKRKAKEMAWERDWVSFSGSELQVSGALLLFHSYSLSLRSTILTQFFSLHASAQVFHYLLSLISVFDKKGPFKPNWAGLATITQAIEQF